MWALGTGKNLQGRMGLDLGGEKSRGWLDRVVGKGILGRKECSSKCTEIRTIWSLCGKGMGVQGGEKPWRLAGVKGVELGNCRKSVERRLNPR